MNQNVDYISELLLTKEYVVLLVGMYDSQPKLTCFKVQHQNMIMNVEVSTALIKDNWIAVYEQIAKAIEEREAYYEDLDRNNERQRSTYKQSHRRF